MKITLTQSGGLLGRTKTATVEWPYPQEEFTALVKKLETKGENNIRDGYEYFLRAHADSGEISVSIKDIEEKYNGVFEELFNSLKFM